MPHTILSMKASLGKTSCVLSRSENEPPPRSEHGGLGLQDGLGSGVPGELGGVFDVVPAGCCGVQLVVPPHVTLERYTSPLPPKLALNLLAHETEAE